MKTSKKAILTFVGLLLILSMSAFLQTDDGWITYTHPEFGFSFTYPSNWYLEDNLTLKHPSGTVNLSNINPEDLPQHDGSAEIQEEFGEIIQISIGLHLVEWNESVTPKEWLDAYQEATLAITGVEEETVNENIDLKIDGYRTVRRSATTSLLSYDVILVERGNTMWFIWSNSEPQYQGTFERIVKSFIWTNKNLPDTLEALNIEPTARLNISEKAFEPINVGKTQNNPQNSPSYGVGGFAFMPLNSVTNYRVPYSNKRYNITAGPGSTCGSSLHTGNAGQALDYATPYGTTIYSAQTGNIIFNGWDSTGYGNLVGVEDSDGQKAYYAHLNARTSEPVGNSLPKHSIAGWSGNTGCGSCGYHLHFHVREGSTPIDIRGITLTGWSGCSSSPKGWAQYPECIPDYPC